MTETFCTSGAVKLKAGAGATTLLDTQYTMLINQAESFINAAMKDEGIDFVDLYSTLGDNTKKILEDAASSHAAVAAINYDMGGFTSRTEAQVMLDVNYTRLNDCIALLKDKKVSDYIRSNP